MSVANLPSISDLSAEQKRALLAALARDLMGTRGGPLSVHDPAGDVVIYMPPSDARERAERAMRERTPEQLAELQRRAADPDNSFSAEEALQLTDEPDPGTAR